MTKKKKAKAAAAAEHRLLAPVVALRDTAVVRVVEPLAKAADEPPLLALALGTLALGTVLRRPAVIRTGARMVASHLVATGMKTLLKAGVDRTRPQAAGKRPHLGKGSGTKDKSKNAFPSGHTAGAVAVAQAIAHEAPAAALPARSLAGAAGALQVPRGAHYASDVIAGAVVGWLAERIAGAAIHWAERKGTTAKDRRAEAEAEAHPS